MLGTIVQRRVAVELVALLVLSASFVFLFPTRSVIVDIGLALLAIALIGLNSRYTRSVIWKAVPDQLEANPWRPCVRLTALVTALPVLGFLLLGSTLAYSSGGWVAVADRTLNAHMIVAFALYVPWALLQQALFQFYLLGRLRTVFHASHAALPCTINAVAYGAVHLPDVGTTLVSAAGGMAWSLLYLRYRLLLPLAVSHAALGTAFYYWLYGRDLAVRWIDSLNSFLSAPPLTG